MRKAISRRALVNTKTFCLLFRIDEFQQCHGNNKQRVENKNSVICAFFPQFVFSRSHSELIQSDVLDKNSGDPRAIYEMIADG